MKLINVVQNAVTVMENAEGSKANVKYMAVNIAKILIVMNNVVIKKNKNVRMLMVVDILEL